MRTAKQVTEPTASVDRADVPAQPPRTPAVRLVSAAQAAGLTGVWIALGLILHLDGRLYVAMGIPLVIAFQLWVRRRPLRDLWVRDGDPFTLDRRGRRIAVALAAYPVTALGMFAVQDQWLNALMALCCLPGAVAAGYAIRRQNTRVLAAVAGVLAALGPARSASKVDVLKAVVTD